MWVFWTKKKFGIVPYFVELSSSQLKDVEHFVGLFDEFFNCVVKKTWWICTFDL